MSEPRDEFPPCPMHGEGFICDHDPNEDYFDEWENAGRYYPRTLYPTLRLAASQEASR